MRLDDQFRPAAAGAHEVQLGGFPDDHEIGLDRLHDVTERRTFDQLLAHGGRHDGASGRRLAIQPGDGVDHRRQRALHVRATPPVEAIAFEHCAERIARPVLTRHDIDRVHVRVEQEHGTVCAPLDDADHVARLVGRHTVEAQALHFLPDARCHRLLVAEHTRRPYEGASELDQRLTVSCRHSSGLTGRRTLAARTY